MVSTYVAEFCLKINVPPRISRICTDSLRKYYITQTHKNHSEHELFYVKKSENILVIRGGSKKMIRGNQNKR